MEQALERAREERKPLHVRASALHGNTSREDASTPSHAGVGSPAVNRRTWQSSAAVQASLGPTIPVGNNPQDFWENELRGYRLLKAAHLTKQERQNVLTQTNNSTAFATVSRALRTLFAEDEPQRPQKGHHPRRFRSALWNEELGEDDADAWFEDWDDDGWWQNEATGYWNEWFGNDEWHDDQWGDDEEDIPPDENAMEPEEKQHNEAYALASEATRTLQEARDAVKKVRQARGYYAPEQNSGKGMSPSSASRSPTGSGKGYGSPGGKQRRPCFICGRPGHGYEQCPDCFSPGKHGGKGKKGKFQRQKGFSSKGKGRGSFYSDICTLTVLWNEDARARNSYSRVVIDTGASESAVGASSLDKLLSQGKFAYEVSTDDRPVFRFGNGLRMQALSRVDLKGTALGELSFYVLGGTAENTPPLLGSKVMHQLNALVSYANNILMFEAGTLEMRDRGLFAVPIEVWPSWHLTLDLQEHAMLMEKMNDVMMLSNEPNPVDRPSFVDHGSHEVFLPLYVMSKSDQPPLQSRLQLLAQRLHQLRSPDRHVPDSRALGDRRPEEDRMAVPGETLSQVENQPVCSLGDVHSLCPSIELHGKEASRRSNPAHGPQSTGDHSGHGESAADDESRRCDRESGRWENHGGEGQDASARLDADSGDQHVFGGLQEENGLSPSQECIKSQIPGQDSRNVEADFVQGDCGGGHQEAGRSAEGDLGQSEQFKRCSSSLGGCYQQGRFDQEGEGCTSGEAQRQESRLDGWSGEHSREFRGRKLGEVKEALMSLRERMNRQTAEPDSNGGTTNSPLKSEELAHPSFEDAVPIRDTSEGHLIPKSFVDEHGNVSMSPHGVVRRQPGGIRAEANAQSKKNRVLPNTARKMAFNVAFLGAMVLCSFQGLLGHLQGSPDFLEVACSPESALSSEMVAAGFNAKRINYVEGFDLDSKQGTSLLRQEVALHPPRFAWISMPCTRLSSLTNLTARSDEEWAKFEKKQARDIQRSTEVAEGMEPVLETGGDLAWEWPTSASKGWKSKAIKKVLFLIRKHGRTPYWCRLDGCAYGLEFRGVPIKKAWTILTTSRSLWLGLQKRCPGHSEHAEHGECRGAAAQASSYYPPKMVKAIVKAIQSQWEKKEEAGHTNLALDVETYMLDVEQGEGLHDCECHGDLRKEEPQIFALTRNRFPENAPTGKKLEAIKMQMMRVHRASGHSSFSNLQKLLRARKAPQWAIDIAGSLECPTCSEAKQARSAAVASLKELPAIFEVLGMDCFEFEHGDRKFKCLLMRDRASGLAAVEMLQEYGGKEGPRNWEPSSEDIISCMCRWLMVNPAPRWIITDSATYFTSGSMLDFCAHSGIGVLTTPAEAHEMLGGEEGCIKVLRETAKRVLKEEPELTVTNVLKLAAHGHNQSINSSGFSPFQWTRGGADDFEAMPGADPKKAFEGLLKLKTKAKVAYEMENAKYKLSKLNNAAGRPVTNFKTGQLVMLWRQKNRPGKVTGSWIGPMRLLLQEGNTLWLATGATLIRARTNQVRSCTKQEELGALLEGTAVLTTPTTVESLMKNFTGKHYMNVTGEVPSERQRQEDLGGAEIALEPSGLQPDSWRLEHQDGKRWLVRIHSMPRLALFTPARTGQCPVEEDQLSGKRVTVFKPMIEGAEQLTIEDDFKEAANPHRQLQERWKGMTRLELKDDAKIAELPVEKRRKKAPTTPTPASVAPATPAVPAAASGTMTPLPGGELGEVLPDVPDIHPVTTELRSQGHTAEDGVPATPRAGVSQPPLDEEKHSGQESESESSSSDDSSSSSSGSSSSSEELKPDKPVQPKSKKRRTDRATGSEHIYALEIPFERDDLIYLANHPKKATAWLSKKMESKGKELRWNQLPLEKKKEFDDAQARELSQVLVSRALRSLTADEKLNLNPKSVMNMRWVLTTKSDGTAKARLVVLGYQAPNLTEVQASAPTMNRLSRNVLLMICANQGFDIMSGDVSSAFLQAAQSLEDENLVVWAPSELAVLYGADPGNPMMPLKICKAFYGLVHAPRKWFDHVAGTLKSQGWRQSAADRCIFMLMDGEELVGISGLHVDDFLIGGNRQNECFRQAEEALRQSYRWGKWDESHFEFAGCVIERHPDKSISISQEVYINKWLEEVDISPDRANMKNAPLNPQEISMLRGVIGTLSWKASQTGPHYMADVSLLLSEIPYATIETLHKANKLVREVRRDAAQALRFPFWNTPWQELSVVTWADASQHNRPDKSSTLGLVTAVAPKQILEGEECELAVVSWRSAKTPRQCLGSNGAEVQAITEGEDVTFRVRALLAEFYGTVFTRGDLYEKVKKLTSGAIVMDSRGVFDAMTRNVSALHGLRSSRAGYELTLAVCQALKICTQMRWVNGMAQLADALTKSNARKVFLQLMSSGQRWRLVHDDKFVAGRKLKKKELLQKIRESEQLFVEAIAKMAREQRWPWIEDDEEVRNGADERIQLPCEIDVP